MRWLTFSQNLVTVITIAQFYQKPFFMRFFNTLLFCFALVASGSAQLTVLELLAAAPSNSHFNDIVSNDDLNALLDSEADLTVLVPNNDAIDAYAAAMGMTTADFIASESAVDMALYHIVPNAAIMFSVLSLSLIHI